jgi:hypothetical protein
MVRIVIRFYFEFDAECTSAQKVRHFNYAVGPVTLKSSRHINSMPLDITIKTTEQVLVTIAPVTSDGKPLVSAPSWTVSAGIATLVVATDGLSAQLVASDTPGDSQITIKDTSPGGTASDTVTLHCDLAPPPQQTVLSFGLTQGAVTPKGSSTPAPTQKSGIVTG